MTTPIIKTKRLILTPPIIFAQSNVDHFLKWLCNEQVVKYSEQRHKPHTVEGQREYLKSFDGIDQKLWEIKRNGTPIGSITSDLDRPNSIANIAIMMGETLIWGQGYASEAWNGVCSHLFEDGVRKAEAGCMASNRRMRKLLDKCGFAHEATLPNYFLLEGKPEDMVYYGRYNEKKIIPLQIAAAK